MVRTVALAHDSLCTAPVPMHPATIAVLHSQPLADSTPTLRSPSDYFSDTLLVAFDRSARLTSSTSGVLSACSNCSRSRGTTDAAASGSLGLIRTREICDFLCEDRHAKITCLNALNHAQLEHFHNFFHCC